MGFVLESPSWASSRRQSSGSSTPHSPYWAGRPAPGLASVGSIQLANPLRGYTPIGIPPSVANAGHAQREPKSFRRDGGQLRDGGNYKAKPRFDPAALLNQPCAFHSREGNPATHTTADCHTLREIERHGERGRTPRTTRQTVENSATWPACSIPSQASTRSARRRSSPAPSPSTRWPRWTFPSSSTGRSSPSPGAAKTIRHASSTQDESLWWSSLSSA